MVVYGRRRLGKSTLIKRVISDNDVYFLADRSEGEHQRVLLARMFSQVFPDFDKLLYPDWESIFLAANYRAEKRFTLCLDEFPYLVEQSEITRKASLLPFAKNKIIVPVLFLKTKPLDFEESEAIGNGGAIMLPEDVVALYK